jgi:hypothetical protein
MAPQAQLDQPPHERRNTCTWLITGALTGGTCPGSGRPRTW